MVFIYRNEDTVVVCEPVILLRVVCENSLVICWYSLLTGELIDATLQSWN